VRSHLHPGFEFLYVLTGELLLHHGETEETLGPGDSVYFESGTPHSYQCAGPVNCTAMIVTVQSQQAPSRPASNGHTPERKPDEL
jgi:quercetin dioxygenase-like cupin family protein